MAFEFTPDQIQAAVEAASAEIRQRAVADATRSLENVITATVANTVREEVQAFIKAEVAPAIRERLTTDKAVLIEAALVGARAVCDEMAKAMVASVTQVLSRDYARDELLRKMFGGH